MYKSCKWHKFRPRMWKVAFCGLEYLVSENSYQLGSAKRNIVYSLSRYNTAINNQCQMDAWNSSTLSEIKRHIAEDYKRFFTDKYDRELR
jgi:hypothetical protein